jgi:hypothetical protein
VCAVVASKQGGVREKTGSAWEWTEGRSHRARQGSRVPVVPGDGPVQSVGGGAKVG